MQLTRWNENMKDFFKVLMTRMSTKEMKKIW